MSRSPSPHEGAHQAQPNRLVAAAAASVALAVLALLSSSAGTSSPSSPGRHPVTLRFHVLFSPFNYTDLGEQGVSAADVIVFHD